MGVWYGLVRGIIPFGLYLNDVLGIVWELFGNYLGDMSLLRIILKYHDDS